MATRVKATYTPTLNLSITKRDGRIVKVTSWRTGNPASKTKRTFSK